MKKGLNNKKNIREKKTHFNNKIKNIFLEIVAIFNQLREKLYRKNKKINTFFDKKLKISKKPNNVKPNIDKIDENVSNNVNNVKNVNTPPVDLDKLADGYNSNKEASDQNINTNNSDQFLKESFYKILNVFNRSVAEETLFANLDMSQGFNLSVLFKASNNAGLVAEMRRINIFDINSGTCILLLKGNKKLVLIDGNTIYNPITKETKPFVKEEINTEYIGYTIFFYEVDLKISSFIKRTGFLFSSISGFKTIFVEILILSIFINLFALIVPFYSMNVFDRIIPNSAMSSLLVLSFGVILAYIFDAIFKCIKLYATEFISGSIGQEIDQKLYDKLVNMKAPGITMSNGAKISLFKELQMVRDFYFSKFIPMLIDMPFVIIFIIVLMMMSPLVAMVPVVISIIIFIFNILMQVPMQNTHAKMMQQDQNRSSFLTEQINNIETTKTFNAYGKNLSKWLRLGDTTYVNNFKYINWVGVASNVSALLMNLNYVFIVIISVYEITQGALTSGALIAASTLGSRIMMPVVGFAGMVVRYRSIQDILRHLEKIIAHPSEDEEHFYSKKGPLKGKIEFRNVSFFYPMLKQPILAKCNFTIHPGEKVGIIGKTGAGKSTITRLLLGLDFPNEGQVLFDNIDNNDISIKEIRANIGYLPQRSQFFRGTLKENILLTNKDISEEQYKHICNITGVNLIIERTGIGDDMIINEQGSNISGGQQQIIGLARAIINNPPILVLDEPTTGMDTVLEQEFMKNIANYSKDKTLVLITHKAAQLVLVDRVILIDKGHVLIDDTKEKVLKSLLKN